MKIWIKLFIGSVLGVGLGLLIDPNDPVVVEVLQNSSDIVIRIGRYIFFPLMFFSLAMAMYELRQAKITLPILGRTFLYLPLASLLFSLLGSLSVLLLKPARIPIIAEKAESYAIPTLMDVLRFIFPENFFHVFTTGGQILLPLFFLAFLLGIHFSFDTVTTKPVIQFFNSLNRIFYQINIFLTEILGIGFIALAAWFVCGLRMTAELVLFKQVIILLSINTAVILGIILPLLMYFLAGKRNFYVYLYGMIAPILTGFFSGDLFFSLPLLIRHGKENLGFPRHVGAFSLPFHALFGKAGTAMVTAVSFIVILKSYSSLGINLAGVAWVTFFSFLISFTLGTFPRIGVFVALSVLCSLYGRGIEDGYLILKPLLPILVSFSVTLDLVMAAFNTLLISIHQGVKKEQELSQFI
ncbi:MAG: dicarboxylate/amino acid:cation symporter [Spirochaetales bacterium]|nr:dicarboxylate/amino acid:cation symporter [Spirochaetales bacterium]